ncbi:MAG: biosynthetic-type acetolactate synthase large subunit [Clostridiaceae bacterium]|nr:biosynthetic-type acetolactate synthase large subunit [Clostridiaceae bacterium]
MNGAEWIVDFLTRKGVQHAFGYPGGPVVVLYEAIYKAGFPHILSRHEQGAVHAAEGYAKVTGFPGVVIATSGPGATNLVTGLADAYLDSVPLLAITGAVARKATGTDAFQEADITGITQPVTKYNYLVMNPDELLPILEEAWQLTTEGRPGPVLVNVPKDILASPIKPPSGRQQTYIRHRPPKVRTCSLTDKIYNAIRLCRKPLLLAGGGCVIAKNGTDDLQAFAESLGIPVATTLMGKGAIPENHPLYLGNLGMHGTPQANTALGNCDLLLAVGSRFSDRIIGDPELFDRSLSRRTLIHVDIDLAEIGKNLHTDIEIEDDAAAFFEAMLAARPDDDFRPLWQPWLDSLLVKKKHYQKLVLSMYRETTPLLPQYVIHQVAERLKGTNPLVVTDVGQHQMFTAQHYPVESPRSFITSGGLGTMGFGLPASIGAALAAPKRTTVLFAGDGGFQMTIQELGLLAQLKLPVKILIMDNCCLGMVRQWQELFFNKHYSCTLLDHNPDFVKIAEAYGIPAGRASDGPSLRTELEKALTVAGPYLIHCLIDPRENVYPMIPAGKMPQDLLMPGLDNGE